MPVDPENYAEYTPFAATTPAMKRAVGWLRVLFDDNAEGAGLHLLTSMAVFPAGPGSREFVTRPIEHRVLDEMLNLSEHEQATVLAIAHGVHPMDEADKTDEMWEAEREHIHLPRQWQTSSTQVEVPFGKWWTTWAEPGEQVPELPDWVSVEGWHRSASTA